MFDERKIKEAKGNVKQYLAEGLLKKQTHEIAKTSYIKNTNLSLQTAQNLLLGETEDFKPYLWVIVSSYYAMYYAANAVLLSIGYKVGDRISHKVTSDSLIVFARDKLRNKYIEEYEECKQEALQIMSLRADGLLASFDLERKKRSLFQYSMDEEVKRSKAKTSFKRAKAFVFEMKKLL